MVLPSLHKVGRFHSPREQWLLSDSLPYRHRNAGQASHIPTRRTAQKCDAPDRY